MSVSEISKDRSRDEGTVSRLNIGIAAITYLLVAYFTFSFFFVFSFFSMFDISALSMLNIDNILSITAIHAFNRLVINPTDNQLLAVILFTLVAIAIKLLERRRDAQEEKSVPLRYATYIMYGFLFLCAGAFVVFMPVILSDEPKNSSEATKIVLRAFKETYYQIYIYTVLSAALWSFIIYFIIRYLTPSFAIIGSVGYLMVASIFIWIGNASSARVLSNPATHEVFTTNAEICMKGDIISATNGGILLLEKSYSMPEIKAPGANSSSTGSAQTAQNLDKIEKITQYYLNPEDITKPALWTFLPYETVTRVSGSTAISGWKLAQGREVKNESTTLASARTYLKTTTLGCVLTISTSAEGYFCKDQETVLEIDKNGSMELIYLSATDPRRIEAKGLTASIFERGGEDSQKSISNYEGPSSTESGGTDGVKEKQEQEDTEPDEKASKINQGKRIFRCD